MSEIVREAERLLAKQAGMLDAATAMDRAAVALDRGALPAEVGKPLADLLTIAACNLRGRVEEGQPGMQWGDELWRDVATALLRSTADPHGECFGAHNGPDGPVDCDGRPI